MNKRIQELAEQAGLVCEYNGNLYALTNDLDCLEHFAELIVRECGVALSPMLRDQISRGKAFDLIKQHFGVEE